MKIFELQKIISEEKVLKPENNYPAVKETLVQALYQTKESVYTVDFYTSDTKLDSIDKALDKLFSYTFQILKEEENT